LCKRERENRGEGSWREREELRRTSVVKAGDYDYDYGRGVGAEKASTPGPTHLVVSPLEPVVRLVKVEQQLRLHLPRGFIKLGV